MQLVQKQHIAGMNETLRHVASLPEAEAQCLPGWFYTDPRYFDFEVKTFLSSEWHCLGRADEIPEPGDYFTTQLFDEPLLVVRGEDGQVRVLSNLCRHRGMPIAEGSGSTRRFVCSYNAWSYARNGELINAPRMRDKGVTTDNCSLPKFRSEFWNGFIYVNLNDNAAPLSPRLEQLEALLGNYETDRMRHVATFEEDWHTNWKCLVENFMEAYHLSVVHPETLHPYTPTGLSLKTKLSLQIVCMGLRLRWRGKRGVRHSPVQGAGTIAGSCRDIWLRRLGSAAGNSSTGCVDC